MQQAIGWFASAVLVLMIVSQIARQWKEGTSKGVSRWLFVGQMVASGAFVIYSALIGDIVFIVTNSLMFLSAVAGFAIVLLHRKSGR